MLPDSRVTCFSCSFRSARPRDICSLWGIFVSNARRDMLFFLPPPSPLSSYWLVKSFCGLCILPLSLGKLLSMFMFEGHLIQPIFTVYVYTKVLTTL